MRTFLMLAAYSSLVAAGAVALPSQAAAQSAGMWQIGPVIQGRNYSVGMPRAPIPAGRGWYFDFPYPHPGAGHVNYVTFNPGSLAGKSRIVVRYRVDASPGVRFVPRRHPEQPATISLYFQRRGDNWGGSGQFEHFRWFAPAAAVREIRPGVHEMSVSLRDGWTSVLGRRAANNPWAFDAAIRETASVGLLFGTAGGRGHGVYATGPSRFTLISFRII
jgi:hypothetical protein